MRDLVYGNVITSFMPVFSFLPLFEVCGNCIYSFDFNCIT